MAEENDSTEDLWPEALAGLPSHLSRWQDLFSRRRTGYEPDLTPDEEHEFWKLTYEVLMMLAYADRGEAENSTVSDLLYFTAKAIKSGLGGRPPKALRQTKNSTYRSDFDLDSIRIAVAYYKLSEEELIPDPAYNKTIRSAYDCSDRQVQRWAKEVDASKEIAVIRERLLSPVWLEASGAEVQGVTAARLEMGRLILANGAKHYRGDN